MTHTHTHDYLVTINDGGVQFCSFDEMVDWLRDNDVSEATSLGFSQGPDWLNNVELMKDAMRAAGYVSHWTLPVRTTRNRRVDDEQV